ncbi:MAG: sulfotransferase domain-containing protein [Bacteroidetes bacterium]|nr:sulfotransferase domain-containing protein [Bacteroidota bacterium]
MRVFVNSVPKSGTNLMEKLIRLVGIKRSGKSLAYSSVEGRHSIAKHLIRINHFSGVSVPIGLEVPVSVSIKWLDRYLSSIDTNRYISGHAAYSEQLDYLLKSKNIKTLQMFRDPRAVLVSWAKYIVEDINKWHPYHDFFKSLSLHKRIRFLITGGSVGQSYYSSFKEVLSRSAGWLYNPNCLIVRFEDLVGSKGGGSDELQRKTILNILKHIDKEVRVNELEQLQSDLFGGTHTFRGGQIDQWEEDFNDVLHELIKYELQDCDCLKKLGYDKFI